MALSNQERAFLNNFQREFNDLSDIITKLKANAVLYAKRPFTGIPDVDGLDEIELSNAKLTAGVNLVTEISNLLGGLIVNDEQDWQAALDQIRRL